VSCGFGWPTVANEIEERKQFLEKMYELGRGPKYEPIIRLEIQEVIGFLLVVQIISDT
jgi:hypothetical protein